MKSAVVFLFLSFISVASYSQVAGCTDPNAVNYNASATDNNGSCLYNATAYTPIVKVDPLSDSVIETSGLQMAGGYLWTFNDRGGKAALYRIDSTTNNILQRVILQDATNIDWEDIAFDGTCFYIGDFGNNETGEERISKFINFLSALCMIIWLTLLIPYHSSRLKQLILHTAISRSLCSPREVTTVSLTAKQ